MITRDSHQSISGTAQNARQRFGEVLEYHRKDRDLERREVAHRCKVPIGTVEQWEEGKALPNSDEWKALCRGVNRGLNAFSELYHRARKEADDEARARAANKPIAMRADTKINTALGDKLAAAVEPKPQLTVVPPIFDQDTLARASAHESGEDKAEAARARAVPNRDTETHAKKTAEGIARLPGGWKTTAAINKRRDFVLNLIRQRPNIRATGNDSVTEALQNTFGVTMATSTINELREQVKAEIAARTIEVAAPSKPLVEVKVPVDAQPNMAQQVAEKRITAAVGLPVDMAASAASDSHEAEINTAVQLILESIPGLQTFTISVDEHGEASVDFQIRKVRVETVGGSMKVKR